MGFSSCCRSCWHSFAEVTYSISSASRRGRSARVKEGIVVENSRHINLVVGEDCLCLSSAFVMVSPHAVRLDALRDVVEFTTVVLDMGQVH